MSASGLCLALGADAAFVDPFAAPRVAVATRIVGKLSPSPPVSPRSRCRQTLLADVSDEDDLELPPSPRSKIAEMTNARTERGESDKRESNPTDSEVDQEQRKITRAPDPQDLDTQHAVQDLQEPPMKLELCEVRESEPASKLERDQPDSPPCPDSPRLGPTIVHCSTANTSLNRTMRPQHLPLVSSSYKQETTPPITPLALPPTSLPLSIPPAESIIDLTEPTIPITPTVARNTAAPPPTPTFGGYSPPPSSFATTAPVLHESQYARRGSTGTFGGARSRGSIIQIPTSVDQRPSLHTEEFVSFATALSEGNIINMAPSQTPPRNGSLALSRTPPDGHWQPESPAAIMQHLIDARERNELAILPAEPEFSPRTTFYYADATAKSSPSKLAIKIPPSSGTPLLSQLQEEHVDDPSSPMHVHVTLIDDELGLPSPQYWNNRHTGMFDLDEDQVDIVTHLRDRSLSEAERVLGDLCETDDPRTNLSTEIVPDASPPAVGSNHMQTLQSMYRSHSIDSGSSGYADSVHTTASLIPAKVSVGVYPDFSRISKSEATSPTQPGFTVYAPLPAPMPAAMAAKSELPAEQKALLVKRTRKLERVLGEPLPENTVERFVVEPSMAPTTFATKIEDAPWPRMAKTAATPEWLRDDCVPQRASRPSSVSSAKDPWGPAPVPARSRIARALLGDPVPAAPTDMRIFVSRERHVAETREGELHARQRAEHSPHPVAITPRLKMSTGTDSSGASIHASVASPEETGRRARRSQLSKLQRLLGDPISAAMLNSPNASEGDDSAQFARPNTLTRTLSNSSSVITERTRDRWTSRFRRHRPESPSPSLNLPHVPTSLSSSPVATTFGTDNPDASSQGLSIGQRRLARKRATKLGKLFGDRPPPSLYMPSPAVAPGGEEPAPSGSPVYQSYRASLNSLLYLVEHDQERLAHIVDELDDTPPSRPLSPVTQAPTSPKSSWSRRNSRRASAPPLSLSFSPPNESSSPYNTITTTHPLLISPVTSPLTSPVRATLTLPASPPDPHSLSMRRRRTSKLAHFFGETSSEFSDFSRPQSTVDTAGQGFTSKSPEEFSHLRAIPVPGGPPRPVEPIVHNGSPEKFEFHALPPPPPPRKRPVTAIPAGAVGLPTPPPSASLPRSPASRRPSSIAIFPSPTLSTSPPSRPSLSSSPERRSLASGLTRRPTIRRPSLAAVRRRETLDGVLTELWQNVQSEVGSGSVAPTEAQALEGMMGLLRQKRDSEAWAEY